MDQAATLRAAIDLLHVPSQVRLMRSAPLPDGVLILLRIAAGDEEVTRQAAQLVRRPSEVVREAAAFYVEQILLFSEADSYRVLGASPAATTGELRRNMALLVRWLHPDLDQFAERSVLAARVTRAWNDLKTPERRAEYDQVRRTLLALKRKDGAPRARPKGHGQNRHTFHSYHSGPVVSRRSSHISPVKRMGLFQRFLLFLLSRTAH